MSSRHRKPISGKRIVGGSAVVTMVVALLSIGLLSAVSFARPDHSFAPPVEAKFFGVAVSDASHLQNHPHAILTDFSGPQSIRVKQGDTLSKIAARVLGSPKRWPILWWDNQSRVPNPNSLRADIRIHYGHWHHVRPWLSKRALNAIPKPKPVPVASSPTSATTVSATPLQSNSSTPAASYSGAPGSFQSCVIARESGGNPGAVNASSGAGGLYQFLPSTWAALGFPGLPENASVAMQNAAFAKAYAESGTSPWAPYDGC
jgi:hypothetical protein